MTTLRNVLYGIGIVVVLLLVWLMANAWAHQHG
jgi:hypothetical protein